MKTTPSKQRAHGKSCAQGHLKSQPSDFQVDESLAFELTNAGEHVYLYIEKVNLNTQQVVERLAKFAGVKPVAIGYAGLKDKQAITRQWFSIHLPKHSALPWQQLNEADPVDASSMTTSHASKLRILNMTQHAKKLQRGALKHNQFLITLRAVSGAVDAMETRLQQIRQQGFPNYFGEQRFGLNGRNLLMAEKLFADPTFKCRKHQRSLYLSAARSYLFNQLLTERIHNQTWASGLSGDLMMLKQTHSVFLAAEMDETLQSRLQEHDISPTGPLYGLAANAVQPKGLAMEVEQAVLRQFPHWLEGLETFQLKPARRSLRAVADNLTWQWLNPETLQLAFSLPSGSYATSLLFELGDFHSPTPSNPTP